MDELHQWRRSLHLGVHGRRVLLRCRGHDCSRAVGENAVPESFQGDRHTCPQLTACHRFGIRRFMPMHVDEEEKLEDQLPSTSGSAAESRPIPAVACTWNPLE